jgi:tetratricopeptide (TPR) repeat protein
MSDPRVARFTQLLAQNPENDLFRFSLAQALDKSGDTASAIIHYRQCASAKADWMMPRILLGKALLKLEQIAAGHAVLEDALALAIDQNHEEPEAELRALLAKPA